MATRLRDRMIAEMEVRGLNPQTQKEYMDSMLKFFEFYKDKPPMKIGIEDIKSYQLYLTRSLRGPGPTGPEGLELARFEASQAAEGCLAWVADCAESRSRKAFSH